MPFDPDKCCPICGVPYRPGPEGHHCDPRTLAGIDGAHRREPDDEEPRRIPIGQRLYEGLQAIEDRAGPLRVRPRPEQEG